MVASANNNSKHHRLSFARSLSSIHLNIDSLADQVPTKKTDRRGTKSLQRRSISPTSSRADIDLRDMSPLPFDKNGHKEQSNSRPTIIEAKSLALVVVQQDEEVASEQLHPPRQNDQNGFRKDYLLGETVRSCSHMMTSSDHCSSVASLQKHDFAFVKRSDGSFSYAILAWRSFAMQHGGAADDEVEEECMTFVVDDYGSTKKIRQSNWAEFVCLVRPIREM